VLVSGPCGSGKTAAVHACAEGLGYKVCCVVFGVCVMLCVSVSMYVSEYVTPIEL